VMHAGTIRAVLSRDEASPSRVMALALAKESNSPGTAAHP
jgi:hypothetical protein